MIQTPLPKPSLSGDLDVLAHQVDEAVRLLQGATVLNGVISATLRASDDAARHPPDVRHASAGLEALIAHVLHELDDVAGRLSLAADQSRTTAGGDV